VLVKGQEAMVVSEQTTATGEDTVSVRRGHDALVIARDSYGWRRPLTQDTPEHGFRVMTDHVDRVRDVMARRAQRLSD
jgi:hypothetical protein